MSAEDRELFILRHGKSEWDLDIPNDVDRPLAKRGKRDCRIMSTWSAQQGLLPDVIVSSTAERAAETARRFGRGLGLDEDDITWEPRLYLASLTTLLDVLGEIDADARQVVLVAHNPGLDHLVTHLHGKTPSLSRSGKLMTTAAVAWFQMPDDWTEMRRGAGTLVEVARPKELAPF